MTHITDTTVLNDSDRSQVKNWEETADARALALLRRASRPPAPPRPKKPARRTWEPTVVMSIDAGHPGRRGLGAGSAGQSGDTQGLSDVEDVDAEGVEELVEEGQSFEAGVVAGVEDADARPDEVRSRQVQEDDVPLEYLEKD